MKKYIREMLDDLRKKHHKDYVPPVPKPPAGAPAIDLSTPPPPSLPRDLENQILSTNPEERLRQLDFQAQQSEEEQTLG
ncbi:MAG TPA: hypothetical protein VMB85_14685 [Bryobacteraceae bacterium]|jgi:hypothetical protein|nr:hypothetical protein [Bryobacteraceae bacterium]